MEQSKIRMLAEAGVAIAIAQVLSFITIFHMPQGGSIKAVSYTHLDVYKRQIVSLAVQAVLRNR